MSAMTGAGVAIAKRTGKKRANEKSRASQRRRLRLSRTKAVSTGGY